MSDLIEPKVANQLPVAPLPLLGTDLIVVSRNGVNLLQSTIADLPASILSGFTEAVQDIVSNLLVAGSNVSLVYNDGAGTLTVSASGGGGALTQTITSASATSGITVSSGANIIKIDPPISANVNFPLEDGILGDTLTLFITQDSTGFREVIVDGVLYTDDSTNTANTKITIELAHDGVTWNPTNSPRWN